MSTDSFTSSGTWTCPVGITSVQVESYGAGGGGGAPGVDVATDSNAGGSGGGSGAYSKYTCTVIPGRVYNVNIGTGGAGNNQPVNQDSSGGITPDANPGDNGGNTTFVDSTNGHVLAGAGGGSGGDTYGGAGGSGGAGDYSTITTVFGTLITHNDGNSGDNSSGIYYTGAAGGNCPSGGGVGGAQIDPENQNGNNGTTPGGGGGGGSTGIPGSYGPVEDGYTPLTAVGGNGANGKILITYGTISFNNANNFFMFV